MSPRRLFKGYSTLFGISCSAVFCLGAIPEARAESFNFTTFSVPGSIETSATGVNNSGQVVGWYLLPEVGYNADSAPSVDGFVLNGSTLSTIAFPGALQTFVTGINDSGEIVGYYSDEWNHFARLHRCRGQFHVHRLSRRSQHLCHVDQREQSDCGLLRS